MFILLNGELIHQVKNLTFTYVLTVLFLGGINSTGIINLLDQFNYNSRKYYHWRRVAKSWLSWDVIVSKWWVPKKEIKPHCGLQEDWSMTKTHSLSSEISLDGNMGGILIVMMTKIIHLLKVIHLKVSKQNLLVYICIIKSCSEWYF